MTISRVLDEDIVLEIDEVGEATRQTGD